MATMDIKLNTTTWIKNKNTNNINEFQHPREQYTPKIVFCRPQTGVEKEYLREKLKQPKFQQNIDKNITTKFFVFPKYFCIFLTMGKTYISDDQGVCLFIFITTKENLNQAFFEY